MNENSKKADTAVRQRMAGNYRQIMNLKRHAKGK